MKTIFIIDTYPNNQRNIDILNECIDAIKVSGYDVAITSHLPIDSSTSEKVEFVIYDKDNSFLPSQYNPHYWQSTAHFDLTIFTGGHSLPICRNMKNGIELAKSRNYEYFVFTEADVIIHQNDMRRIEEYISHNKEMFLFRPEEYRGTDNSYVYETLLFGGKPEYFLSMINLPTNTSEWLAENMGFTLEQTFYEKFGSQEEKFVIINDHSSNIFKDSKVNLTRYGLFNCEMVYNELHPTEPILFIINSLIDESPKYVDVMINGIVISKHTLHKGQYWFDSFKFNGHEITVNAYDTNDYLFETKTFQLIEENNEVFKQKGIIKLK